MWYHFRVNQVGVAAKKKTAPARRGMRCAVNTAVINWISGMLDYISSGSQGQLSDPAGNRVPLQTMRPVGAHIADDAVNVCDVVAHTRWTVSTASTGGSVLTFGV